MYAKMYFENGIFILSFLIRARLARSGWMRFARRHSRQGDRASPRLLWRARRGEVIGDTDFSKRVLCSGHRQWVKSCRCCMEIYPF